MLVMVVGMFPTFALADEAYTVKEEDVVWNDDRTQVVQAQVGPYTLTNRDDWLNGDTELSIDNLGRIADKLSDDWAPIAGSIFGTYSPVTINNSGDRIEWKYWYGPGIENGDSRYGGGCEVDVVDALAGRSKKNKRDNNDTGGDRYNRNGQWRGDTYPANGSDQATYMTSGMQYASSLDEVLREMCDMSATAYYGNSTNETQETVNKRKDIADKLYKKAGEDDKGLSWMKDDADGQTSTQAMYRIVSSQADNDDHQYSNNYALIFYDFQLTALTGDEVGDTVGVSAVDYSAGDDSSSKTTDYIENRSQEKQEEDLTLSNSTTETVSSSFTDTNSVAHSINWGVEAGFEYQAHGANNWISNWKWSLKLHFQHTWTETNSTAYTKGEQLSNSSSSSTMSRVYIPAHTALAYEKATGKSEQTLTFDCPAVLNYKVAIVSLCWRPREEDDVKTFSTRFGCGVTTGGTHATQNLYKRAVDSTTRNRIERSYGQTLGEYRNTRVNGISWDDVEAKFPVLNTGTHIQNAATQLPLFTGGMKITAVTTSVNTTIGNIQPLYQLAEVRLTAGDKRYSMAVGDTFNLDGLAVDGFNAYGIDYYGFQPTKGEWVLCDENGNEIDSSGIIDLDGDAVSGSKQVVAKSAGKAYLKWVIANGTTYKAKEGAEVTRSTKSLQAPIILISVSEAPTDLTGYKIEAEGEPIVVCGEQLNLNNAFKASVVDANDRIVSQSVGFEARDAYAGSPVSIDENGMFVSEEAGDYKVRATYTLSNAKDSPVIRSDWLTVHVADLPVATVEPTELAAEGGEVMVTLDGEHLADGIEVKLTDENGAELTEKTSGTGTQQVATFEVPANTVFDVDKVYNVTCMMGGKNLTEGQTVTVTAHTLEHHDAVGATCTEDGNIEYWKCNETSKLYRDANGAEEVAVADVVVSALGHDLVSYDAVNATCTEDGSIAYWECTRCHTAFADAAHTEEIDLADVVVPATGHDWGAWVVTTPATEETVGVETRTCANEATHTETRTVDVLPHAHVLEHHAAVTAKCEVPGSVEYWECTKCGALFSDGDGTDRISADDIVIAATGHDWGAWVVTTAATETTEGSETRTCANDPTHTETRDIPKSDHVHSLTKVVEAAATCTNSGTAEHWKCEGCERLFSDENGQTEVDAEDLVVDATGHDWDEGVETTPATCTANGVRTYTCKNDCGATRTEPIDATGHDWGEGVETTAPTCTANGVRTYTCKNDETHTKTEPIDALGHDWGEGVETKAPTCTANGVRTYTCKHNCGATRTEPIDALGHDWGEGVETTAPTCTAKGVMTYTCKNDDTHTKTGPIDALGHDWGEGEVTTAPTCTAKGVMTYTCKNDDTHTKSKAIAATGHKWGKVTYTWSKDLSTVTARRVCSNDPNHVQTEKAQTTRKVTKNATCTAKGSATYTATFSNAAFKKQTKTTSIPALGHKWGTVRYAWSKDLKTCTATRVCTCNGSHRQTAKAKVTSKVTSKATATKAGTRTYTAAFTASWAKNQTRKVSIPATGKPTVSALSHMQNAAWLSPTSDGKVIGLPGRGLRLEAYELTLVGAKTSGGIEYRSRVQGKGWEKSWSRNGKMSGTTGQSKRIEAVQIRLYGSMAKQYNVYYRTYSQKYGWMGWTKNGAKAGSQGKKLRVEAMQVVLVKKGGKVPSAVYQGAKQAYSKAFVK